MHYLLYVTYFINVTHAYASGWPLFKTYWLKFRFGITGVKRFFHQKRGDLVHPPNLTRALGKGRMSSFFLSFFLSNNDCFFFHMLDWMFTKLGQKHVWVYGYKTYTNLYISLRPSTYVMRSKVNLGSFGVTRVKRSFSLNMHYLLYVT